MTTEKEKILKLEHDLWLATQKVEASVAKIDYNIMMGTLEDPSEGEEEAEDE